MVHEVRNGIDGRQMIRLNSEEFSLISDVHRTIISTIVSELQLNIKNIEVPVDITVHGSITKAYYQVGEYLAKDEVLYRQCSAAIWAAHRRDIRFDRSGELVLVIDNEYYDGE